MMKIGGSFFGIEGNVPGCDHRFAGHEVGSQPGGTNRRMQRTAEAKQGWKRLKTGTAKPKNVYNGLVILCSELIHFGGKAF